MPEQPRLSDKTAKWIGSFVANVTNLVAVPIREMYLTIGHSFVSGMTVLGLIAGGVAMYAIERQEERLGPVSAALVQTYIENTEATRLRNIEKATQIGETVNPSQVWSLVAINADTPSRTLDIEFPPVPGATQLLTSWQVISSPLPENRSKQGLWMDTIPSGGLVTISNDWPDIWQSGDSISFTLEQLTEDGRRIRNIEVRRVVLMP